MRSRVARRCPRHCRRRHLVALRPDLHHRLDLDRDAERQRRHPDRRPRSASRLAEDLDEQLRAAVDHRGLLGELRRAPHEPEELHHPLDPVEIADLGAQRRQQPQAGEPGGIARVGRGHVVGAGPDPAGDDRPVGTDGACAGEEHEAAGPHGRHVEPERPQGLGQDEVAPVAALDRPVAGVGEHSTALRAHRRPRPCSVGGLALTGPPPGRSRPPCRPTTARRSAAAPRRRGRGRPAR